MGILLHIQISLLKSYYLLNLILFFLSLNYSFTLSRGRVEDDFFVDQVENFFIEFQVLEHDDDVDDGLDDDGGGDAKL